MGIGLNPNLDIWSKDLVCWERGQESGRTRPINEDVSFQNLLEIKEVFSRYNIPFWLSHGTCLSAVRDSRLTIKWDDDSDFGAYFQYRDSMGAIIDELKFRGFYIPPSIKEIPMSKENAPWYDLNFIRGGEKAEFWFFEKQLDGFYIYDKPRCGNTLRFEGKYFDTLDTINLKGYIFNVPHDVKSYLTLMYGPSYMTPDPNKKYNSQG